VVINSANGVLKGKVTGTAANYEVNCTQTEDLELGDINAQGGNAVIKNLGGGSINRIDGTVSAETVTLETAAGSIGSSDQALITDTGTATLRTDLGGSGSIFLNNISAMSLTLLDDARAAGTFNLESNNGMSVGTIRAQNGSIGLRTTNGRLLVRQTVGDSLVAGGSISLVGGNELIASVFNTIRAGGDIALSVGALTQTCEQLDPNVEPPCAPAGADGTLSGGGRIYWGDGLQVDPPVFVDAIGKTISFAPNGALLRLQQNVIIRAGS
jgi:hypothetical protein